MRTNKINKSTYCFHNTIPNSTVLERARSRKAQTIHKSMLLHSETRIDTRQFDRRLDAFVIRSNRHPCTPSTRFWARSCVTIFKLMRRVLTTLKITKHGWNARRHAGLGGYHGVVGHIIHTFLVDIGKHVSAHFRGDQAGRFHVARVAEGLSRELTRNRIIRITDHVDEDIVTIVLVCIDVVECKAGVGAVGGCDLTLFSGDDIKQGGFVGSEREGIHQTLAPVVFYTTGVCQHGIHDKNDVSACDGEGADIGHGGGNGSKKLALGISVTDGKEVVAYRLVADLHGKVDVFTGVLVILSVGTRACAFESGVDFVPSKHTNRFQIKRIEFLDLE